MSNEQADSGIISFSAPLSTYCTKNAFQSRFPVLANGVSTKWDAMIQFLASDSYALQVCGLSGAPVFDLRMLVTTGKQRLDASPFVDMVADGQAAALTYLLTQIPNTLPFWLSNAERTVLMTTPLAEKEIYRG